MQFVPCNGKCTDSGSHCEGCGRAHEDVAITRKMVGDMAAYVQKKQYDNPEEFARFINHAILFKLANS